STPILVTVISRSSRSSSFPYTTLFRSIRRSFCTSALFRSRGIRFSNDTWQVLITSSQPKPICAVISFSVPLLDAGGVEAGPVLRSEEHTSELQSREQLVCRLLREKNKS